MALSRNYFELFGLPQQFDINHADLSARYRALQSQTHPDRFVSAGATERRIAAQSASLINEAFAALKDAQLRAQYLLSLSGVESGGESETTADMEFLMQQMEWRESLESASDSPNALMAISKLDRDLRGEQSQLEAEFARHYLTGALQEARAVTQKMQFFKRLIEQARRQREALEEES